MPDAEDRQQRMANLLLTPHPDEDQLRGIRQVLLTLACRELRAYRRRMRTAWLLRDALIHRQERAAYLELLRTGPSWWRHRPSEWIGADPSLASLRQQPVFEAFVREQTHRDFAPAPENDCPGEWFQALLPVSPQPPAGPPPVGPPPPPVGSLPPPVGPPPPPHPVRRLKWMTMIRADSRRSRRGPGPSDGARGHGARSA